MQASEAALCEQDLFAPFVAAHKPPEAWRVGIEAEFFGVRAQDGAPLRYEEEAGVQTLFTRLTAQHGWQPLREHAAGPVVALQQGGASITLEPGAQVELSGSPWADVHAVAAELAAHRQQLQTVGDALGVRWLGLGFHPWATLEELGWVPKLRYAVMRRYLPTRGGRALDMMQRTCTVQVNLDYTNEQDALRKMTVALRLQPVVATLFANSPWLEGRFAGCRSERLQVWLDVDADRTGLLPFLWQGTPSYTRYVEWALDVPMFLIKRGAQVFANTGQSFRTFMREGFQGMHATAADWQTHLNTLFPEVRLKQTLEIRGVDGQSAA
ncbi:MAG: glutamate--cysteine ligase, partial [Polyangiales bacterium]